MNAQFNRDLKRVLTQSQDRLQKLIQEEMDRREVEIEVLLIKYNVPEEEE
jgi:hypothetical protein